MSIATVTDRLPAPHPAYCGPGDDAPPHLAPHVRAIFRIGFDVTETGCWEYRGYRDPDGYGRVAARVDGQSITRIVHRVMYQYLVGEFPDDRPMGLHHCDNPPCANPAHIHPGTHEQNMREMVERGRSTRGRSMRFRTHCPNDHEYTERSTYWNRTARGLTRMCRECRNTRQRKYRARLRGQQ